MWTSVLASCRAALPFLVDNIVPIVNFIAILGVIISVQKVHAELARRAVRIRELEETVDRVLNGMETARLKRFAKIEHDISDLQRPGDG